MDAAAHKSRFIEKEATPIRSVAIIGTGTQGSQIAYRCAISGYPVVLFDAFPAAREGAFQKIRGWLHQYVNKGKLTNAQAGAALARISVGTALSESVSEADLVIEAVPEQLRLKQEVWQQIDSFASAHTLLATNSSSIRSSLLAVAVQRKDRTFNVNFDFPVDDDLMEIMWNAETSEETKSSARVFVASLGMIVLETRREIQGFSFNRVWRAIKKECLHLFGEGYCDFEELDRHFVLTFGTAYGPFALMDKIGLDVVRDIELSYYHETNDPTDKPPQALLEMIAQGHLGVKTGKGFYNYPHPSYEEPDWLHKGQSQ
jgi:3-hydroxybutyryl-CoA dehydrogenase